MLKIGVLVSGSGSNLQAIIDAIEKGSINGKIVSVVSSNSKAFAIERAKQHNIPYKILLKKDFEHEEYSKKLVEHFKYLEVDLIIFAGFMVILTEEFTSTFANKMINIHPSLIPSFCGKGYYGLKVHEAVIKSGVKITGATVHFVNEIADGGPIILQKAVEVLDKDTPEILQKRVMEEAEWVILPEAVRLFCDNKLIIENGIVRRK